MDINQLHWEDGGEHWTTNISKTTRLKGDIYRGEYNVYLQIATNSLYTSYCVGTGASLLEAAENCIKDLKNRCENAKHYYVLLQDVLGEIE